MWTCNPYVSDGPECCRVRVQIAIGQYARLDIYDALSVMDELMEDGDCLAARQLLWSVGRVLRASTQLEGDEMDDYILRREVDHFIEAFRAVTEDR